ncbi:MAG: acyltransferase [Armatimonadota bacterium]
MAQATDQSRYKGIDAARGFAAIAVLVAHAIEIASLATFKSISQFIHLGAGGVYLFFMISGFVIPFSLKRVKTVKDFAIGRVFRMYPLFIVSLAVSITGFMIGATPWLSPKSFVLSAVLNLTMVQEFLGFPSLRGAYWTLGYELVFYCLLGTLFALNRSSKLYKLSPTISVLLILLNLASWVTGRSLGGDRLIGFAFMFLGCAYYSYRAAEITKRQIVMITALAVSSISLQWFTSISINANSLATLSHYPTMLVAVGGFIVALSANDTKVSPLFVYLGTISYSIYLVHGVVLIWLRPTGVMSNTAYFTFALFASTVLVSALTYRFIEQPGIKLGKRLVATRSERQVIAHDPERLA